MYDREENARDDAEAARRFPGPDYYEVLAWIHALLEPRTYVEIGVLHGNSLRLAPVTALCLGIDPHPPDGAWPATVRFYPMTSGEFFGRYDLADELGAASFDFAFIDGSHLVEHAAADFDNLERFAGRKSLIAIHDTIPLDERTAARERTTEFHTGDIWKMIPLLARARPHLSVATVLTAPSGLTLVSGFGSLPAPPLRAEPLADARGSVSNLNRDREGADFAARTLPNHPDAVAAWLQDLRQ